MLIEVKISDVQFEQVKKANAKTWQLPKGILDGDFCSLMIEADPSALGDILRNARSVELTHLKTSLQDNIKSITYSL